MPDLPSSFEEYKKPNKYRSRMCPHCGAETSGRVVITLQARQDHPERTAKDANRHSFPSIASKSATFCESCAIRVFETARAALQRPEGAE